MRKRICVICLLFVFSFTLFASNLWGASYEGKKIIDIQVKGNYSISSSTILNRLKIQPGDQYQSAALNNELKRMYGMGFFNDVSIEVEEVSDGVVIIFDVEEKPLVISIDFEGNKKIRTNKLKKTLTIQEGDLLDLNQLSIDMAALKSLYIAEGFNSVIIDNEVVKSDTGDTAKIIFHINEGTVLKVKSIKIEGNYYFKRGELIKLMSTKTAWWMFRKGSFDEEKFKMDLSRIGAFYRSKGFLDVKVTGRQDYSTDGKSLELVVVVEEGEQYKIGDIKITGNLTFPKCDIEERIKMKSGDSFDYDLLKEDLESIRSLYYNAGYMNARVDMQHQYNPTNGMMDVTYVIDSFDEVSVGKVNILGNTKTRDKVIRREIRVYPGEIYDGKQLKRSKERIYNLGYFEDVFFETVPTDDPNIKDLNVSVKETKTGEFSFGGGYSSVDAFIGFAQIRQRNFDIMNFPTFTGGGQDLVIRGEGGSARTNYFLSWTDPWIFDYPLLFGFDLYREEHEKYGDSGYGYDEVKTGGSLRFGKELTEYLNMGLVYNLEEVKISNIPDNATSALRDEQGKNLISRLTWNTIYDKRDNKFSPTKGYYLSSSFQNAGGFIGGDKDFVKGSGLGKIYFSFFDKIVLELKGSISAADTYGSTDSLPIYERYFAGGATTIRGYQQRAVGPRDSGSDEALGGEAMILGNAEVNFPIYKNIIKGAVFYDVGNVWSKVEKIFQNEDSTVSGVKVDPGFKQGTGVGVRVKTPIGPVKLDWGYPLTDNYEDKKKGELYFSISHGF